MKKFTAIFTACLIGMPVFGADSGVAARMDCTDIQARISELSAIENPDDATTNELTQLQASYRSNCAPSAAGRRTSGRAAALSYTGRSASNTTGGTSGTDSTTQSALTVDYALNQFLMELQGVCRNFSANIATLTRGGATTEDLQPLIDQYHINCLGEQVASTTDDAGDTSGDADDTNVVAVDPAVVAENVAAGLCPDGSKPNKFGCCAGETFKDIGNLEFACCPEDGNECYPPITIEYDI